MTPTSSNAAIEALRQDVAALSVTIAALGPKLDNAVTHREATELVDTASKLRKRTAWTVVVSVLGAMLLTLATNNVMLTRCFLRGSGSLHPDFACNVFFPGYNGVVKLQQKQVGQFNELIREIPRNRARVNRLQHRVDELEKRLNGG